MSRPILEGPSPPISPWRRGVPGAVERCRRPILLAACVLLSLGGPVAADWQLASLDQEVARPQQLLLAAAEIGEMDGVYSLLLARGGRLVVEEYFREGTRSKPHNLKSASKSVLSALVGIAAEEGRLDLDQPIAELLPEAQKLDDPRKRAIKVRHLLAMTSGLEAMSYQNYNRWIQSRNWVAEALEVPMVAEPGTLFQYSTGNTHLLSAVLEAATGMSTKDYAEGKLFGPIGAEILGWEQDPTGVYVGGNNLSLSPRDMAKFGQLFLNQGRWGDRQVVPRDWVRESTRRGERGLHDVYGTYRDLWWTDLTYEGAFIAVGFGGQYIYVSPPHDAVIVVTSTLESKGRVWTARLFDLLRNGVLAALEPSASYYAGRGLPPVDPALESLELAVEAARTRIAGLKSTPPRDEVPATHRARTRSRVNLRRAPEVSAGRLTVLESGIGLEVLDRTGDWMRVRAKGLEGWIHTDYAEPEVTSWRVAAAELRRDLELFSLTTGSYLEDPEALRPSRTPEVAAVGVVEIEEAGQAAAEEIRGPVPERDVMTEELETAVARIAGLEAELGEARGSLAAAQERLQADQARQSEEEAVTATATELASARGRIAELEGELGEARNSLAKSEERLRAAEARKSEAAAGDGERIAELEAELQASRAALAAAEDGLLDRKARQVGELAEATAAREQLAAELEGTRSRLLAVEEELSISRGARSRLEARLAELESRSGPPAKRAGRPPQGDPARSLEEARGRIATLEAELGESSAGRDELEKRVAELERERLARRKLLAETVAASRDLAEEVESARSRLTAMESDIRRARSGRPPAAAAPAPVEAGEADLRRRLRALEAARGESEQEIGYSRVREENLKAALGKAEQTSLQILEKLKELRREWESQRLQLAEGQSVQRALATELRASRAEVERLRRELRRRTGGS